MNIKYSYASEDDAYGINYVSAYSWKETYKELLPEEYLDNKIKNIPNKTEGTKEFLKSYKGKYVVAKDNDKVIGILSFLNPEDKEYGYLGAIYVLKEYQGYGIGKKLFEIAVKGIKEAGYNKMKLECMSGNNTINFYKKYGGVISNQIDYPIKNVGNVKADVVLFEDLDYVLELLNKQKNKSIN